MLLPPNFPPNPINKQGLFWKEHLEYTLEFVYPSHFRSSELFKVIKLKIFDSLAFLLPLLTGNFEEQVLQASKASPS